MKFMANNFGDGANKEANNEVITLNKMVHLLTKNHLILTPPAVHTLMLPLAAKILEDQVERYFLYTESTIYK